MVNSLVSRRRSLKNPLQKNQEIRSLVKLGEYSNHERELGINKLLTANVAIEIRKKNNLKKSNLFQSQKNKIRNAQVINLERCYQNMEKNI